MTARNWSSPASSGTGAEPRGSGPKRRGAACWTAPGHGSRTERSCGAAGRAAAGAQREVLRLSGVIHAVGGPDVLHGRVLAALLGPEERVLQHPARATREAVGCAARNAHGQPRRCRRTNSRRASQRSSNLARGGRKGSGPFCQAPRYPKTPPTPSAATATSPSSAATAAVSSIASAPRSTSCARCPASSRRRSTSLGRPMICGGGCAGC